MRLPEIERQRFDGDYLMVRYLVVSGAMTLKRARFWLQDRIRQIVERLDKERMEKCMMTWGSRVDVDVAGLLDDGDSDE